MSYIEQSFWIEGTMPGLNATLGKALHNRYMYGALKKECDNRVIVACKLAKINPVTHPALVTFVWVEKDRRRDPDNIDSAKKFILDGLIKAGILKGDGWKHIAGFGRPTFTTHKTKQGVKVIIHEQIIDA